MYVFSASPASLSNRYPAHNGLALEDRSLQSLSLPLRSSWRRNLHHVLQRGMLSIDSPVEF